jgi:hypothetical protein
MVHANLSPSRFARYRISKDEMIRLKSIDNHLDLFCLNHITKLLKFWLSSLPVKFTRLSSVYYCRNPVNGIIALNLANLSRKEKVTYLFQIKMKNDKIEKIKPPTLPKPSNR